jgi:hypothetical protein
MSLTETNTAAADFTSATPRADGAGCGRRRTDVAPRPDLYLFVHKGLRACLGDTLARCGRPDCGDSADVARTLAQVRALLALCRAHLDKEERYLHPAMEARRPGSTRQTAGDHASHLQAFADLEAEVRAVEQANGTERVAAALQLYRYLALFVADNLEHMHVEEVENNEVLWATHGDAELLALQQDLVRSIPPDQMAVFLHWMIPAMAPAERALLLSGIKRHAPAEVFATTMGNLKPHLAERDWNKLMAALAGL